MDDDDDDDDFESSVPVRPYCMDSLGGNSRSSRERKIFAPKPPSERRAVEKSLLSWAPQEETAQSLMQAALRRQHNADFSGVGQPMIPQRFQGMTLTKFGVEGKHGHGGGGSFATGASGLPAPRQTKQYKEGKSLDLADLAFTANRRMSDGSIRTNYAPISVPYFSVVDDDNDPPAASSSTVGGAKKGRPTLHHVDESNSNAAKELFLNSDGDLREDNFLLIQLPAVLPELTDVEEEEQRVGEDAATAGAGASITRMPDGLLGKLKIHKSGKVRMEIGGLPFCVDQGCATFFQQELACVCPLAKEMVGLGPIQNRVVVTPDLDAMLDLLGKAPGPSAAGGEPAPPPDPASAAAADAATASSAAAGPAAGAPAAAHAAAAQAAAAAAAAATAAAAPADAAPTAAAKAPVAKAASASASV